MFAMNTNLDPLTNHNPKQLIDRHQDTIVLVCVADNNYAMPLAVTVRSVLENLKGDRKINLFVLDGGISQRNKKRITRSLNSEKCNINWIECPDVWISKIQPLIKQSRPVEIVYPVIGKVIAGTSHTRVANYYPLLIPELLPVDCSKAIYLDTDMVVLEDLGSLWELKIEENNYFLAVQEISAPFVSSPGGLINYQELGLTEDTKFFTTGTMLIDLKKWRTDRISMKAFEYLHQKREFVQYPCTHTLNAVIAGRWGNLDPRWNQSPLIYEYASWEKTPFSEEVCRELYHVRQITYDIKPYITGTNLYFIVTI
jgi:lipopolysaccharide biosynthesis glycosyltransferase